MKTKAKFGFGLSLPPSLHSPPEAPTAWNEDLADELHASDKRKFQRRHVISYDFDDVRSCDLN